MKKSPSGVTVKSTTPIACASQAFAGHPQLRQELLAKYENVKFNDTGRVLRGKELVALLQGCEKAIVALDPITEAVLAELPELKVLSKYGVGLDSVDLDAVERRGLPLGWQGGTNRRSVAELALCLMIATFRQVVRCHGELRAGEWNPRSGPQLSGKTVGILGGGYVGQDLAGLLQSFGCQLLVHDIRDRSEFCQKLGANVVTLDELLKQSDVVTVHVPSDTSTKFLIDGARLAKMKPGSILINTARGGIVDEQALKHALKSGHLWGAALDVYGTEPPVDKELLSLPNLITLPHIGGSSDDGVLGMGRAAIDGLEHPKTIAEIRKMM